MSESESGSGSGHGHGHGHGRGHGNGHGNGHGHGHGHGSGHGSTLLRRRWLLLAALFALATPACQGESGPRALILADASGAAGASFIDARAKAFQEQHKRAVRVLRIASGEAAIELAARGEADAAVVPEATPINRFLAANQGADAGVIEQNGARLRVLRVSPKQLPKVDPQGADLAAFLATP